MRSSAVPHVFVSEGLDEHAFLDGDPMNESSGRKCRQCQAHPVPQHRAEADEHANRRRVERVSDSLVRARVDEFMIRVHGQRVSVKSTQVTTRSHTERTSPAEQRQPSDITACAHSDGWLRQAERRRQPSDERSSGRSIEQSARARVDHALAGIIGGGSLT